MAIAIGHEWSQPLDLGASLEDGLVSPGQIVEMRDHMIDAFLDRERLEHVAAHEVGEIADRLHRHGLQKEFERLFALDAKAAAERSAIGREAVVDFYARHSSQALSQRVDVTT